jgi:hypothetical protein
MQMEIFRVLELPAQPQPRAFYYVKAINPNRAEAYMTDAAGVLYPITNTAEVIRIIGETEAYDPGDVTLMFDNALI